MKPIQSEQPSPDRFVAPFFFLSSDGNNRMTFLSRSVKHVLGYEPTHQLGRDYQELFVPNHPLNRGLSDSGGDDFQSQSNRREVRAVLHSDGNEKYICIQSYDEFSDDGTILRKHTCAQDITAQYRQYMRIRDRIDELQQVMQRLTDREQRVLLLVGAGNLNKQIARKLSVSSRTVELARHRICEKFEVDNVTEAIAVEIELRLLQEALQAVETFSHGTDDDSDESSDLAQHSVGCFSAHAANQENGAEVVRQRA
tara:strand:+ start:18846 stop:19610 length:765 start_codon:yes stop_codon:yes gene_type:complete